MTHIKQREEDYLLSTQAIDRLSQICSDSLTEAGADGKDILRIRLSLEEILSGWLSRLGENTPCFCRTGTRFGRQFFEIRAKGVEAMPDGMDGPDTGEFLYGRLMAQAGLSLVYTYKDGMNCLTVNPPKKSHLPQSAQLAVAIASAGVVGVLCTALPEAAQAVLRGVVDPAFDTLLGALRALSSPLIFFAVCCGIISIGDLSTLGKIGKKALSRMCVSTFATGVCMLLAVVWLFPVSWTGAGDASGFGEIYRLFLEIIPSDIVSPFVEGNALQVIFLAGCMGVALLVLGSRAAAVRTITEQANEVVKYLMEGLGRLLPLFVFFSVFGMAFSGALGNFSGILKAMPIVCTASVLSTVLYTVVLAQKLRVGYGLLIKKLLPTFLIGLSTASSSAALAINLETCEKKLGMPGKMANFMIPLGQVLFMPGSIIGFMGISLCMAESSGLASRLIGW